MGYYFSLSLIRTSVSWRCGQYRDCDYGRRCRCLRAANRLPLGPAPTSLLSASSWAPRWPPPLTTQTAAPYWLLIDRRNDRNGQSSNGPVNGISNGNNTCGIVVVPSTHPPNKTKERKKCTHLKWKKRMADCWVMCWILEQRRASPTRKIQPAGPSRPPTHLHAVGWWAAGATDAIVQVRPDGAIAECCSPRPRWCF